MGAGENELESVQLLAFQRMVITDDPLRWRRESQTNQNGCLGCFVQNYSSASWFFLVLLLVFPLSRPCFSHLFCYSLYLFFFLCASFQSIFTSALSPILVWLMGLGSDTVLEKQNQFWFVLLIFVQLSFVWVTSLWTFLWPFKPWEYCAQWDTFQHQLASFVIRYCWFWYAASACSPAHCAEIQMLFCLSGVCVSAKCW